MTSIPIANSTRPIPSTTGITIGRFTRRVATSRTTPNANAGPQSCSTEAWKRSPIGVRDGNTSADT